MSIRIWTADAINILNVKQTELEADLLRLEKELKQAKAAELAFKKALLKLVGKTMPLTTENVTYNHPWHRHKASASVAITFDIPDDMPLPDDWWMVNNQYNDVQEHLKKIAKLLKELRMSADPKVPVTSGVFKSLGEYL